MSYITPRKRAMGLGAAHSGTRHHWWMTISSVALAVLTPSFLMVMGTALQIPDRLGVVAYFARPYPAMVAGAFLILGMLHFIKGTRIMIDDYFHDTARKVALIATTILGWAVIAAAGYALVRMAVATPLI